MGDERLRTWNKFSQKQEVEASPEPVLTPGKKCRNLEEDREQKVYADIWVLLIILLLLLLFSTRG